MRAAAIVLIVGSILCFGHAVYMIDNVPYHRQITNYCCGDASSEMVLHFSGADVDQRAIMDVGRTSEEEGTLSWDLVRIGHFSYISKAVGAIYPNEIPTAGWWTGGGPPRLGLASFGYRTEKCWVDQLRDLIGANIPVVLLMHFAYPIVAHDGHFRVAVGFDDEAIYLHDPWDRPEIKENEDAPMTPRLSRFNDTVLCAMWDYSEINLGEHLLPFYAAVMLPWQVKSYYFLNEEGTISINASVTYPCPSPLCNQTAYIAQESFANVTLPPHLVLVNQSSTIALGTVAPGQTVYASWVVQVEDSFRKNGRLSPITISAQGLISGSLPATYKGPNETYPAYDYTDWIGGETALHY